MALKASPESQALLLDLQGFDTTIAQLDHRAKNLPERAALTELTAQADALRLTLAERTGALEDLESELRRVESDVEVVEARISRDTQRWESSSSVKDISALEQELAALRSRLSDLEEIELTVMERLETQQAEVQHSSAELATVTARMAEVEAQRDAALAELQAQRTTAEEARRAVAARVPEPLLALYERQRSRYGTGATLLRGGVSLASGVTLPENEMQAIRAADPDDVIMCSTSEAILVRTAESGL